MIDNDTRTRWQFHLEWGGYSVPPGLAACALTAARAEKLLETACELDVATVTWEYDDEPYDHGMMPEDEIARKFDSGEWTGPYGCVVTVDSVAVASLWGIVLGRDDTRDPYRRVVESELASECEDELRQAIGDHEDAEQDVTFA